jgi:two-component system CheB/CheR fusion protein
MVQAKAVIKPVRILFVEDSEDILFLMTSELESKGYLVEAASDGEIGLQAAERCQPELIISDVQMPGISGLEFIREIRRRPLLANIPAIALSGFCSQRHIDSALTHGFTAHLVKPVETDELIALIHRLTELKKLTRAS